MADFGDYEMEGYSGEEEEHEHAHETEGFKTNFKNKNARNAFKNIRKQQINVDLLFPRGPFKQIAREVAGEGTKFTHAAIDILHVACEDHVIDFLQKAVQMVFNKASPGSARSPNTLLTRDVQLAREQQASCHAQKANLQNSDPRGKASFFPDRKRSDNKSPKGAKRHHKVLDLVDLLASAVNKSAVSKIVHRAGIGRRESGVASQVRQAVLQFVSVCVHHASIMAELSRRKTISGKDINDALEQKYKMKVYGFYKSPPKKKAAPPVVFANT